MVVQPARVSLVGDSNPGSVNFTPPAPPPKVSRPQFEPPTENFVSAALPFYQHLCVSNVCPHCLEPFEQKRLTPPTPPPTQPPLKNVISSFRG